MNTAELARATGMPADDGEPVFREPWEAQVFALAVSLQERGVFTRSEWAEQLAQCIAAAQASGDADLGDTYYRHWLAALENLVGAKGLASRQELEVHRARVQDEFMRKHDHQHEHDHDHEHAHD